MCAEATRLLNSLKDMRHGIKGKATRYYIVTASMLDSSLVGTFKHDQKYEHRMPFWLKCSAPYRPSSLRSAAIHEMAPMKSVKSMTKGALAEALATESELKKSVCAKIINSISEIATKALQGAQKHIKDVLRLSIFFSDSHNFEIFAILCSGF